jgi:hypothetical protein
MMTGVIGSRWLMAGGLTADNDTVSDKYVSFDFDT